MKHNPSVLAVDPYVQVQGCWFAISLNDNTRRHICLPQNIAGRPSVYLKDMSFPPSFTSKKAVSVSQQTGTLRVFPRRRQVLVLCFDHPLSNIPTVLLSVTFKLSPDTANNGKVIRSSTAMAKFPFAGHRCGLYA